MSKTALGSFLRIILTPVVLLLLIVRLVSNILAELFLVLEIKVDDAIIWMNENVPR